LSLKQGANSGKYIPIAFREVIQMNEQFIQSIRNLNPNPPLRDKEIEDFYVPRPQKSYNFLKAYLLSEGNPKIPVTGPIGVGKSTELNVVKKSLENDFIIISPQSEDMFGKEEMGNISFYVLLIREMLKKIEKEKISEDLSINDSIFRNYQYEKNVRKGYSGNILVELSRFSLSEIKEKRFYDYLKGETESLYALCWAIGDCLNTHHKKRLLFVLDDFEKLDVKVIEEIFVNHSREIKELPFSLIFTYPLVLSYSDKIRIFRENYEKALYLYPVNVEGRLKNPNREAISFFKQVMQKRAPNIKFEKGLMEKMALYSGGIIRSFLHLARNTVRNAMIDEQDMVNSQNFQMELQSAREAYFRIINEEDYNGISKYLKHKETVIPGLERYINQDIILEHRDKEGIWYQINPIIEPLVVKFYDRKQKEKLFDQGRTI